MRFLSLVRRLKVLLFSDGQAIPPAVTARETEHKSYWGSRALSVSQLNASSFEDLVQSAFSDSVSNMLGKETWKAISFYFDISLLANEPDIFAIVLERLLGRTAKVLEKA